VSVDTSVDPLTDADLEPRGSALIYLITTVPLPIVATRHIKVTGDPTVTFELSVVMITDVI